MHRSFIPRFNCFSFVAGHSKRAKGKYVRSKSWATPSVWLPQLEYKQYFEMCVCLLMFLYWDASLKCSCVSLTGDDVSLSLYFQHRNDWTDITVVLFCGWHLKRHIFRIFLIRLNNNTVQPFLSCTTGQVNSHCCVFTFTLTNIKKTCCIRKDRPRCVIHIEQNVFHFSWNSSFDLAISQISVWLSK